MLILWDDTGLQDFSPDSEEESENPSLLWIKSSPYICISLNLNSISQNSKCPIKTWQETIDHYYYSFKLALFISLSLSISHTFLSKGGFWRNWDTALIHICHFYVMNTVLLSSLFLCTGSVFFVSALWGIPGLLHFLRILRLYFLFLFKRGLSLKGEKVIYSKQFKLWGRVLIWGCIAWIKCKISAVSSQLVQDSESGVLINRNFHFTEKSLTSALSLSTSCHYSPERLYSFKECWLWSVFQANSVPEIIFTAYANTFQEMKKPRRFGRIQAVEL